MQLTLERPDFEYSLRAADGTAARVNERVLTRSFVIAPGQLIEDWPVTDAGTLTPEALEPVLAQQPAVVVLGTGATQVFPPVAALAAGLTRGIGIEVMTNGAAARTYDLLAGEGRKVVAAFILPG